MFPGAVVYVITKGQGVNPALSVEGTDPAKDRFSGIV